MPHLSAVQQSLIGLALALFMIVTRSPQLPVPELLHSGSWAVFLAAGVYLGSKWALPAFLGLAFALDAAALTERSRAIVTFALCGFANFSSIAIQMAVTGGLAPNQRPVIARLGLRALAAGSLANLMSAALAGLFLPY